MKTSLLAGALFVALAAPALAGSSEEDLQVVRKAVAEAPPSPKAEARPPAREPQWFRLRIKERNGKGAKVSINLPLGFVRSLGEDWPVAPHEACRKEHHCPTLGEILRALDSGQSLVEIDSDDATVRAWVE